MPKLGAPPDAPTDLTAQGSVASAALNWAAPSNLDLDHFQVFEATTNILANAVMVGDNVRQDIEGALAVGMRAVLLHRDEAPHAREADLAAAGVRVLRSLRDLRAAMLRFANDPITQLPNSLTGL